MLTNTSFSFKPTLSSKNALLFEKYDLSEKKIISKSNGLIQMVVMPSATYEVHIQQEGYESVTHLLTGTELIEETICFGLEKARVHLEGIVTNALTGQALYSSYIDIKNNCSDVIQTIRTDKNGYYKIDAECGCTYSFLTTKSGFLGTQNKISVSACKDVINNIKLKTKRENIVVRDIYYDYNKFNIRPDAAARLNALLITMNKHPMTSVQLSSHTDNRGKNKYNKNLSKNRSHAAKDYLVLRGIQSNRVFIDYQGESTPKVDCYFCDQKSHAKNRRTEIRIIPNQANIKVLHLE